MTKVALYTRVSTNKIEQQSSLENQEFLLRYNISDREVLNYTDIGTGTSFKRKGFQKMMYDAGLNLNRLPDGRSIFEVDPIREPLFKEIVVVSASRLARNMSIVDTLRILWDYKQVNVRFLDVDKNSKDKGDMVALQMFFMMAENEVAETSKRTKRGHDIAASNNKIRNNSIYGWDFNRDKNELTINEDEAEGVKLIYQAILEYGLGKTGRIVNEAGYRSKNGNLWTSSTIKTLVTNPKYKGYNVRNKFRNKNLFTESKTEAVPREEWTVMKNERIEAIVSEELWEKAQQAIEVRKKNGNNEVNQRKYDVSGVVKCAVCGGNYIKSVESKKNSNGENRSYMMCSCKKNKGKVYCDSKNISTVSIDTYIDNQRSTYNSKVDLANRLKSISLKNKVSKKSDVDKDKIHDEILKLEEEKKVSENKLEGFMNLFLNNDGVVVEVIMSKVTELKSKVIRVNNQIASYKNSLGINNHNDAMIRSEIKSIEQSLGEFKDEELSRSTWLEKVNAIKVIGKDDFDIIYK